MLIMIKEGVWQMYFDFLKTDYNNKDIKERAEYIRRDKEHLGNIIIDKLTNDIDEIVERWWKLDSIGYIDDEEKYLELLKEAEELFCFGKFTSCIALIGIGAEEFSKHLANINDLVHKDLIQYKRLKLLLEKNIITNEIYNKFNAIRSIRNSCIHFNDAFKSESRSSLESKALVIINHYKTSIMQVVGTNNIDKMKMFERIISEQELSFEEFKLKNRNAQKELDGIDLQISADKKLLVRDSLYYVEEIDVEEDLFKEMTLIDLKRLEFGPIPFVVNLTLPDVKSIERLKVREKNVIRATVISSVSSAGITEEWKLLSIKDVFRGKIEL